MAFDSVKYRNEFAKDRYDRIVVSVPKGEKESIQAHAASRNESVAAFIKRSIAEQMLRDSSNQ